MKNREKVGISPQFLAYDQVIRPVVFWNLTGRCNLSCVHCYNASGPAIVSRDELTTAEALAFIDDCAHLKVPVLLLTGGEPLIREDLWLLAEHARSCGIRTALSSNGTLITAGVAEKIKRTGIGYVGISLDGATAHTHDQFRNYDGAFDRAVRAFQHCVDAGVKCGVRVTLTKENLNELGPLIDLSLKIGACRFCMYWLVPSGRGADTYREMQVSEKDITAALDVLYQYAKKIDPSVMEFLTVDAPQDAVHLLEMMEREEVADLPEARDLITSMKGGCSAGSRVANVTQYGDVYPCQFAQIREFYIGSIREKPFSVLYNDSENPVLKRFREKQDHLTGQCRRCSYLTICGGGCRVRAYHETGDMYADDPFCDILARQGNSGLSM